MTAVGNFCISKRTDPGHLLETLRVAIACAARNAKLLLLDLK